MRLKNRSTLELVMVAVAFVPLFGMNVEAQMGQPDMVSLKGTLIDLSCAAKGNAMMNSWANTKQDHMMPDGNVQKSCATMCLQGGQPAALFASNQVIAVLACNPRATPCQLCCSERRGSGLLGRFRTGCQDLRSHQDSIGFRVLAGRGLCHHALITRSGPWAKAHGSDCCS